MKCGHFLTSCLAGIPLGIHDTQTWTQTHRSRYLTISGAAVLGQNSGRVDTLYFDFERNLGDVLELSD